MNVPLERSTLVQLLLVSVMIALLGISPRLHQVQLEMDGARRALISSSAQQASQHLANAAKYSPGRADLWELAGRYALQAGDAQAAIRDLEQAPPSSLSVRGLVDLGDAYQQASNLKAAIPAWQAALPKADASMAAELYQRLLKAHRSMDDYQAAIADLQALTALQPLDAHLQYQLGLLLATQQPESALAHLAQAAVSEASLANPVESIRRAVTNARISDDPAYALLASGRALAAIGEWELAVEAFHQATLARPDYAEAWAYLGEARQHFIGKDNSAPAQNGLPDLQKALVLDPKSLAANIFLALYSERLGRFDQALDVLHTAIQLDPRNPVLQSELGNTQALLGDLPSALESYQGAVDLAPLDPQYLRLMAEFSLKYEYHVREIALEAARQAVLMAPHDPATLDLMGQVLIKLGDDLNAERFLDQAIQAAPNYAPAHLHLGFLYLVRGDNTRASQELNLAGTLAPGSPTADQSKTLLQSYFP
jgi:tetratricopeptide (TPR) repeat protein